MVITKEYYDKTKEEYTIRNFSYEELTCSCCGKLEPDLSVDDFWNFMCALQNLRDDVGRLPLSSAWRCEHHERVILKKKTVGYHNKMAVDVLTHGKRSFTILQSATTHFTGVGVSQKGQFNTRFLHLDQRTEPWLYSY